MAASFPGTLWVWTDQVDNTSAMDAADVNAPAAEIIAMQSHFGAGNIVAGQIILNSAAGVDTWISLQTNSIEKWRIGSDESDSEKFKIHTGALVDPSLFEMSSTGHVELTNVAETASDPGRHLYLQRVHTGTIGAGKGLTGVEVRSTFNGSAAAATGEVKGGEFKARHTTGNTYTVGTFKGVIGNVDCKNGTVTTGWAVEGAIDVSSGGQFTTAACFHGNLNNSGTVTNSYGVYVHGLSGNVLARGLYVDYAATGIYLDNCTTDIRFQSGATIVNSTSDLLTITEATIATVGKLQFGGATDWGTGATGTQITGAGYDWVSQTVGRVNIDLNNCAAAAAYHAMSVTADQTGSNTVLGTWTELYIKAGLNLPSSNNYVSVWGNLEIGAGVETASISNCVTALLGSLTIGATYDNDARTCGCLVTMNYDDTGAAGSGRISAFEMSIANDVFDYGLYIPDSTVTTGIDIGACTTGLTFTGALATGISFHSATLLPDADRTDIAFELGSRANEFTITMANAASQHFEPIQICVDIAGSNPTSASSVSLIRMQTHHETTNMSYIRLRHINSYMLIKKHIQDAYIYTGSMDFTTNSVTISGEAAVMNLNMECASGATGNVRGLIVNMYGANLATASSIGIEVRTDGGSATLGEGIRIWSVGANSITAGITFAGTITTPIDMSSMTPSGSLWTLFNGTVSGTTAIKGIYLEITSSKTSSSTEGIRAEAISDAASGTATIRGGNFKANINAGKTVTNLEGVLAHASYANGGCTITTVKGLGALVSTASSATLTNVYGATVHVQTNGSESVSGNYVGLRIENEAIGGVGKEMDSAIQIVDTNVSGDAFTVLIDASGAEISTSETDKVTLMSFKDSGGTTRYLKYDPTNATAVEVSTVAP